MKALSYAMLAVCALVSLAFVSALKPSSIGAAAFFSVWLVLPYAALALGLTFVAKERASTIAYAVVVAIVTVGGLLILTDVIFLHPDPQGGIAVLFTPVWQAVAIGILVPTCRWLVKAST